MIFPLLLLTPPFRGFDGGNDIDTLILKAFNSSNVLIDSESITDIFTDPGLIAKVHGANIAYITFEVSVLGDHGLFFDDLTFNPAPIPGAVWLFASGLIAFWGLRKESIAGQYPESSPRAEPENFIIASDTMTGAFRTDF